MLVILSAKMIDVNNLPALPQARVELIDVCNHQDASMSEISAIVSIGHPTLEGSGTFLFDH
jgi:HD-like signal output (HDOD) protein